jgi:hypothetical protein
MLISNLGGGVRSLIMRPLFAVFLAVAAAVASPAFAQATVPPVPDMSSRIPAPLPPPPQPPEIYGPGHPYQPQVFQPPHLNTFSDRVARCLHQGSAGGLRGGKISAYTRACANDN